MVKKSHEKTKTKIKSVLSSVELTSDIYYSSVHRPPLLSKNIKNTSVSKLLKWVTYSFIAEMAWLKIVPNKYINYSCLSNIS